MKIMLRQLFLIICLCLSLPVTAVELRQHTVEVNDHPVALWSKAANASRRPILLIHGRTWSALPDFDLQVSGESLSVMDSLVAQGLAVYAVDLRGYGATPRDSSGWNTPDKAARDTRAVLNYINQRHAQKVAVLGWSNGSLVAQLVAQRHPELFSELILFGYPADPAMDFSKLPAAPEEPLREPNTATNAASDFITPGTISQAAIDEYVRHSLAADPVRADWNRLQQWAELDPALVNVPTLILHGEYDPLTPDANQSRLYTGLGTRDRAWITLPNADHAALLETAHGRFIQVIVNFLNRPIY